MKEFDPTDGWELIEQRATADNSIVVRTTETHTVFLIKVITWDGVSTPVVHLEEAKTINNSADNQTIEDTKKKLLKLKKYFRICKSCQKRTHAGYCMGDACMACRSDEYDIVF